MANKSIYSPSSQRSNRLKCVSSYITAITIRKLDEDAKGEEIEPADRDNDYLGGYSGAVYKKIRNNDRKAFE